MNRCIPLARRVWRAAAAPLLVLAVSLASPVAQAQAQPQRVFPQQALRAQMVVVNAQEVTLNGTLTRLSPASRIRTTTNALVLTGAIVGQSFVVNYTRDSMGQAHEIWILNDTEAAQRRAGSEGMVITNIISGAVSGTGQ